MSKVAHIFLNVDMRCSHLGLKQLVEKEKITVGNNFVIFLNTARTMVKMFCKGTDVILHYKKEGRVIDPAVLKYLPTYCDGKEINMNKAIKAQLNDYFKRRGK